jgi:hypothetical protein
MDLADGIRTLGFRRWYERQLIESHAYLVVGLLSMVLMLACIEGYGVLTSAWWRFTLIALTAAGAALCLWSLARYKNMLFGAQHAAEHSTCAGCEAYGALEVVRSGATHAQVDPDSALTPWVRVRCRKCGNEWTIE